MTTAPFAPSGSSPLAPASVLADAREKIAGLHEVLWAAKSPREKLDAVAEVERFKSELAAIEAEVVAEVEATKAAAVDQWGSTSAFVTAVSGGYQGSGSSAVRLAQALTGDREATLAALRGAVISEAQARVIGAVVDELPGKPALRDRAEGVLLEHARTLNASELRAVGKRLVEVVDPKGDERRLEKQLAKAERAAHYGRFLSIREDGAGGVWMKAGPPSRTPRRSRQHCSRSPRRSRPPTPADAAAPTTAPDRPVARTTGGTRATTAPGCSMRWSRRPGCCSAPRCSPSRTAPNPGSA